MFVYDIHYDEEIKLKKKCNNRKWREERRRESEVHTYATTQLLGSKGERARENKLNV